MGCANKTRFKDKLQALGALHTIANKEDNRDHKPSRVYYCSYCFGYHLTKNKLLDNGTTVKLKHFRDWRKLL